ncbi:MAG: adenylate/guanylate cyclase domain-containing protein [Flavisolibacter sp.]
MVIPQVKTIFNITNKVLTGSHPYRLPSNILPETQFSRFPCYQHLPYNNLPRSYQTVSVLFTDFKGFTSIADKLSPEELVDELHQCFRAFDDIIEKYHLEKIKTIGDSCMCAGEIPTSDAQHAYHIVKAGMEIQQYIIWNNIRGKKGDTDEGHCLIWT